MRPEAWATVSVAITAVPGIIAAVAGIVAARRSSTASTHAEDASTHAAEASGRAAEARDMARPAGVEFIEVKAALARIEVQQAAVAQRLDDHIVTHTQLDIMRVEPRTRSRWLLP